MGVNETFSRGFGKSKRFGMFLKILKFYYFNMSLNSFKNNSYTPIKLNKIQ